MSHDGGMGNVAMVGEMNAGTVVIPRIRRMGVLLAEITKPRS